MATKITNFGTALLGALNYTGMKQEELSSKVGKSQASISRLISGKNAPARATMHSICTALKKKNYEQAVKVLIGHLEDEIESSGMLLSDIEMRPTRKTAPLRIDIEKHIDIMRTAALKSKETASLLKDLAWLISNANFENETLANVAEESGPEYKTKSKGKK
jgi:transcriptional regulator with XRE-family HTH domain